MKFLFPGCLKGPPNVFEDMQSFDLLNQSLLDDVSFEDLDITEDHFIASVSEVSPAVGLSNDTLGSRLLLLFFELACLDAVSLLDEPSEDPFDLGDVTVVVVVIAPVGFWVCNANRVLKDDLRGILFNDL